MSNISYKIKKISKMNPSVALRKFLSFDEVFTIAYRKRGKYILPKEGIAEFEQISTDKHYWYADPILFTKDGKSFLFMELFDKKAGRGKMAYCLLTEDGPTPIKVVIDEPFHMSFPTVFEFDNDIYMLPETSSDKSFILYRAVSFPDKWERVKRFETEGLYLDTVITSVGEKSFNILTCEASPSKEYECRFQKFTFTKEADGDFTLTEDKEFNSCQEFDLFSRNGGPIFEYQGKRYVAAQQSSFAEYGLYMNYYVYDESKKKIAVNPQFQRITTSGIFVNGIRKGYGIHSYCFNDDYEVIDYKYMTFAPLKHIQRIMGR
ncbi:hypothetical protein D6855_06185 [Butyrivibrio sp. CB08]|uniref:glucosamine inositolphosphorylceramide transferase family protein n=1 Tax=Butyrivibrio sp. CB08 TaxID=2364879 RepID=UPI000EA9A160|nr:hypothetical protein [Butyrivibrio sp. CB08]RKM61479.1 hypothetical protein D6855_06185 [Butyrivibrio sp. CB08]